MKHVSQRNVFIETFQATCISVKRFISNVLHCDVLFNAFPLKRVLLGNVWHKTWVPVKRFIRKHVLLWAMLEYMNMFQCNSCDKSHVIKFGTTTCNKVSSIRGSVQYNSTEADTPVAICREHKDYFLGYEKVTQSFKISIIVRKFGRVVKFIDWWHRLIWRRNDNQQQEITTSKSLSIGQYMNKNEILFAEIPCLFKYITFFIMPYAVRNSTPDAISVRNQLVQSINE